MLLFDPPMITEKLSAHFGYSNTPQGSWDSNLPIREYASKWTVLTGDLETYIKMSGGDSVDKWRIDSPVPERYCHFASSSGWSQLHPPKLVSDYCLQNGGTRRLRG